MGRKVLFVLTSADQIGSSGKATGWYLPEAAHPYAVFKKAGYTYDFVSPKGGKTPRDPGSLEAFKDDPECKEFLADEAAMKQVDDTMTPDQVSASNYDVIFYVGGHGPMFDLPENKEIAKLATDIYENGGIVAAVCHGTVGLVPVTLSKGESILKGQTVTCFTNSEEDAVNLSHLMPFMLETRLGELGAKFESAPDFQRNVCVSGRIITGQNPASATPLGETIVEMLEGGKK